MLDLGTCSLIFVFLSQAFEPGIHPETLASEAELQVRGLFPSEIFRNHSSLCGGIKLASIRGYKRALPETTLDAQFISREADA
jgi:hypothetical protein